MLNKISSMIFRHKIAVAFAIIILAGGGYYVYGYFFTAPDAVRYMMATANKDLLIISVSGSGQVSASNQIDVKSKASGDILRIDVKNGDSVKAGALIAQLDSRDAQKTARDAEVNLESAKLALRKLEEPADAYSILQAENSLKSARDNLEKLKLSQETDYQTTLNSKRKAEDNIAKAYEDSFNAIANTFLNLPTIITVLNDILYSKAIGASESAIGKDQNNISALTNTVSYDYYTNKLSAFQTGAENDYKSARSKYDINFDHYKNTSRYSERPAIESLLNETLETAKAVAEAAKSESNYLDSWADYRATNSLTVFTTVKGYQASLAIYTGQMNNHLSGLLSAQKSLKDNIEALVDAERSLKTMDRNNPLDLAAAENSVKEKEVSLSKLKSGPDALDIQSQELSVKQRENSLRDAQEKLSDYFIRAPFSGVVAEVNIKDGESVSSGAVVATIITRQRVAEISLNEVDVAKVKVGQKTTLTFDAVDGLSIAGAVAEIDAIGAVSQGVVTYNVKVGFDTQDDRIKPGMSVSAAIITDMKQDVITVPNAAIKSSGIKYFVEMLDGTISPQDIANQNGVVSQSSPRQQPVEIGLANESMTEILSGLKDGDIVVARIITSSATQTAQTQQRSLFSLPGTGRISGGGAR